MRFCCQLPLSVSMPSKVLSRWCIFWTQCGVAQSSMGTKRCDAADQCCLLQFFQTLVNGCRSAMISTLSKQKCTMGMHLLDIDVSQILYIGLSPLPVIVLVVAKRYCLQDKWCWRWFLWSLLLGGGTTQHKYIYIYITAVYCCRILSSW